MDCRFGRIAGSKQNQAQQSGLGCLTVIAVGGLTTSLVITGAVLKVFFPRSLHDEADTAVPLVCLLIVIALLLGVAAIFTHGRIGEWLSNPPGRFR